jgi:hypothetical protein
MNMIRLHLKTRVVTAITILAVGVCSLAIASPVAAASNCPSGQQEVSIPVDQGGTKCVPINSTSTDIQDNPIFFYLKNLLYFFAGGVGLAVVGGIVAGSYMYTTARANAAQAQKGQTIILNSVIGLFLFIFMYAILQFLIPGGIFS